MRKKQSPVPPQRPPEPLTAPLRPEPGNRDGSNALNWMVHYAVPLVGVAGAALYGVLRLAYVFFYLWLRATPDEVGYGYSQVLSDELVGAVELVVLVAALIWVVWSAASAFLSLVRRAARKRRVEQFHAFSTSKARRIAVWSLAIAVPVVLALLPVLGWQEGQQAYSGYSVRNVYLAGTIRLPVLAVQAVPAEVAWASPPAPGEPDISASARPCLLYLGQADGTSVFYDVHSQESLRLPTADIVISLEDWMTVPSRC
jgi:hypothetical protein